MGRERRDEGTGRGLQVKKNDPHHEMAGYGPVNVSDLQPKCP